MKILIVGNIGSGKTTVLSIINTRLAFQQVSIDEFRIALGDGSNEKEIFAREAFVNSIKGGIDQIIECTGVGVVATMVYNTIKNLDERIVLVVIDASISKCLQRLTERKWNIPFPKSFETIESKVQRINNQLLSSSLIQMVNKKDNLCIISFNNNENPINASSLNILTKRIVEIIRYEE